MHDVKLPESADDFKKDISATLLAMVNQARFVFFRESEPAADTLWQLVSSRAPRGTFADPDQTPEMLGLMWSDIEDTGLAVTLQSLYSYGVLALEDQSQPLGDTEGPADWAYKILADFRGSSFLAEWSQYAGDDVLRAVTRCFMVCELALARQVLEGVGGDQLYTRGESMAPENHLTIAQMALLAGITEQSLRSTISRKGELQTVKMQVNDRFGANSSFIEITHAKEWLQSKGKYAPVRTMSSRGALPLTSRRFSDLDSFQEAVQARFEYLVQEEGGRAVQQRLARLDWELESGERNEKRKYLPILKIPQLLNAKAMRGLGEALSLPPEAMRLRAAELGHGLRLVEVERELKELNR